MPDPISVFVDFIPLVLRYIPAPYSPAGHHPACSDLKLLQATILWELYPLESYIWCLWPPTGLSVTYESLENEECALVLISIALCLPKLEHGEVESILLVIEFWLHVYISLFLALETWTSYGTFLNFPVLTYKDNSNNHEFVLGLYGIRILSC